MSLDEIWLTKVLLTVLSPFIAMIICLFHKHWLQMKDPEYRNPAKEKSVEIILQFLRYSSNRVSSSGVRRLEHRNEGQSEALLKR